MYEYDDIDVNELNERSKIIYR